MHRTPLLSRLALPGLVSISVWAGAGCAGPAEELVAIPGYPEFTVALSPGVAPGLTDGCDAEEPVVGRLRGRVYDIPPGTRMLPDFAALPLVETVCLDRLHVTPRRSVYPGFPGLRDRFRWFAVDLQGAFGVRETDLFYFRLTSDDGSQLFIDDALVIDNDGYHPPRMALGAARVTAGRHAIRVGYWQGPGPMALVLEVARPGDAYHVFRVDQPL